VGLLWLLGGRRSVGSFFLFVRAVREQMLAWAGKGKERVKQKASNEK
jgi:hypothetical protein